MSMRDLIPWGRQESRAPAPYRDGDRNPFVSFRREMDRLFDDVFRDFGAPGLFGRGAGWPHIEVSSNEQEVRVSAELPGMREQDVELTIDDGTLCIRGEKTSETEDRERGYSERSFGRFERRIVLPDGVREEEANARFENGLLTVTLPRSPEAQNRRRIPINADTRH